MSKRVKVRVGTLKDMGERFVSAWHRLERGEKVRERHVTFPNLPSMLNALTPKRLELLRDVHRKPASSVKALAERLGRDYKRVHEFFMAAVTSQDNTRFQASVVTSS
jgi:predicted transcriptional regulator